LGGVVVDVGDALVHDGPIFVQEVVELALIHQIVSFRVDGLSFDGHFEVGLGVNTLVD
jgi:hypothetical protein